MITRVRTFALLLIALALNACGDGGADLASIQSASYVVVEKGSWCTGLPNQNLAAARASFRDRCGEPWNDQHGHVCDYKSDGFHCNGVTVGYDPDPVAPAEVTRIEPPTDVGVRLRSDRVVVYWTGAAGAEGYNIYRNGQYHATVRSAFSFAERLSLGSFRYTVIAFGASGTLFSVESLPAQVNRVASVAEVRKVPTIMDPGTQQVTQLTEPGGNEITVTTQTDASGNQVVRVESDTTLSIETSNEWTGHGHVYHSEDGVIIDDYHHGPDGKPLPGGISNGQIVDENGEIDWSAWNAYLDEQEAQLEAQEAAEFAYAAIMYVLRLAAATPDPVPPREETSGADEQQDQYGGREDNSGYGGYTGGLAGSRSAVRAPELRRVKIVRANGRDYLTIAWGTWSPPDAVDGSEVQVSSNGGSTWYTEMELETPAANGKKLSNTGPSNNRVSGSRSYLVRVRWTLSGGGTTGWSNIAGN